MSGYQSGYQKGYDGSTYVDPAPGDPEYQGFIVGRNDREREQQGGYGPATSGYREGSGWLIGIPVLVGLVAGVVSLLAGGDFWRPALEWAGGTLVLLFLLGLLVLAIRALIVLLPLAIVVAIVLFLGELVGVGPGLPPW